MCVCVCVFVRARVRACVCLRACDVLCVCVLTCGTSLYRPKERPEVSFAFEFDPWTSFTMFSTSLYRDVRTKKASQKRICEFFVPIEHILKSFVCGYQRGTRKGF